MTSLLLLLQLAAYAQLKVGQQEILTGSAVYYNALITLPKGGISGICVLKANDNGATGSIVNEFGIKALDFSYDGKRKKVRLQSVIHFLDKWYIRRTLKKDLSLLLQETSVSSKSYEKQSLPDGSLSLDNKKYKITYLLTPIQQHETAQ